MGRGVLRFCSWMLLLTMKWQKTRRSVAARLATGEAMAMLDRAMARSHATPRWRATLVKDSMVESPRARQQSI